jgi:hypothetical protein
VTAFADEIGDDPMLFSLLEIFDGEPRYLRPPEATTEQNRDHGVVTPATYILTAERRKARTQKAAIRSFIGGSASVGKPQVDSGGGILGLFEPDPVARHHGPVEGEAGFRAVPVDELTDRMVVRALGAAGGQTVTADFDCSRSGRFRMVLGLSLLFVLAMPAVWTMGRARRASSVRRAFIGSVVRGV